MIACSAQSTPGPEAKACPAYTEASSYGNCDLDFGDLRASGSARIAGAENRAITLRAGRRAGSERAGCPAGITMDPLGRRRAPMNVGTCEKSGRGSGGAASRRGAGEGWCGRQGRGRGESTHRTFASVLIAGSCKSLREPAACKNSG